MIIALILGGITGWIAGKLMHTKGGLLRNILLGIVGSVIIGVAGACVVILVARWLFK